jgi:hypothetical protein
VTCMDVMLNLYDRARLEGSRIYDRKAAAAHWKNKLDWFSKQLALNLHTEASFTALGDPVPEDLAETIQTITDIVEACSGHYELHA